MDISSRNIYEIGFNCYYELGTIFDCTQDAIFEGARVEGVQWHDIEDVKGSVPLSTPPLEPSIRPETTTTTPSKTHHETTGLSTGRLKNIISKKGNFFNEWEKEPLNANTFHHESMRFSTGGLNYIMPQNGYLIYEWEKEPLSANPLLLEDINKALENLQPPPNP